MQHSVSRANRGTGSKIRKDRTDSKRSAAAKQRTLAHKRARAAKRSFG